MYAIVLNTGVQTVKLECLPSIFFIVMVVAARCLQNILGERNIYYLFQARVFIFFVHI